MLPSWAVNPSNPRNQHNKVFPDVSGSRARGMPHGSVVSCRQSLPHRPPLVSRLVQRFPRTPPAVVALWAGRVCSSGPPALYALAFWSVVGAGGITSPAHASLASLRRPSGADQVKFAA